MLYPILKIDSIDLTYPDSTLGVGATIRVGDNLESSEEVGIYLLDFLIDYQGNLERIISEKLESIEVDTWTGDMLRLVLTKNSSSDSIKHTVSLPSGKEISKEISFNECRLAIRELAEHILAVSQKHGAKTQLLKQIQERFLEK